MSITSLEAWHDTERELSAIRNALIAGTVGRAEREQCRRLLSLPSLRQHYVGDVAMVTALARGEDREALLFADNSYTDHWAEHYLRTVAAC